MLSFSLLVFVVVVVNFIQIQMDFANACSNKPLILWALRMYPENIGYPWSSILSLLTKPMPHHPLWLVSSVVEAVVAVFLSFRVNSCADLFVPHPPTRVKTLKRERSIATNHSLTGTTRHNLNTRQINSNWSLSDVEISSNFKRPLLNPKWFELHSNHQRLVQKSQLVFTVLKLPRSESSNFSVNWRVSSRNVIEAFWYYLGYTLEQNVVRECFLWWSLCTLYYSHIRWTAVVCLLYWCRQTPGN